jgi:hypothetical protein
MRSAHVIASLLFAVVVTVRAGVGAGMATAVDFEVAGVADTVELNGPRDMTPRRHRTIPAGILISQCFKL